MNEAPTPQLEDQLRALTTWQGPSLGLWKRALAIAGARDRKDGPRLRRMLRRPIPGWVLGGVAAVVIFVVVGIWMTQLGGITARRPAAANLRGIDQGMTAYTGDETASWANVKEFAFGFQIPAALNGRRVGLATVGTGLEGGRGAPPLAQQATPVPEGFFGPESTLERQVIRKATVELATEDVRATFLKASLLISEAQGEYVQDSSLTGHGKDMQANLTLRVAADRLPSVLNELRQLGEVRSETSGGEDVTTQVVDLEARLRNEQRVEAELLELLEKRNDAPLKEILELRNSINQVRQTIEQLTAQRQRLSRLVSLATVLVIIRPADAPAPTEPGLGTHFVGALRNAWRSGVLFLANTLAGLFGILIGGLVWWVLLVVVILVVRAYRRRTAEPAQ